METQPPHHTDIADLYMALSFMDKPDLNEVVPGLFIGRYEGRILEPFCILRDSFLHFFFFPLQFKAPTPQAI